MLISSAFTPLLGDAARGPIGKAIDTLAIIATLFGTATSLGLGAQQINSGLNFLWGTGKSNGIALTIIGVLTVAFILSAVSGVGKGIQYLSNINMVLAVLLLVFLGVVGPTTFILNTFPEALGDYLSNLVSMSFRTAAFSDGEWLEGWTIFYWAWWVSWAPFVGVFIARISRGRTIREFVTGVLLIPSVVTFVWFTIMGGAALIRARRPGRPRRGGEGPRGGDLALRAARPVSRWRASPASSPCSSSRSSSSRAPTPARW